MDFERITGAELSRIEKYVNGIVLEKINIIQDGKKEKEKARKLIKDSLLLKKLCAEYDQMNAKKKVIDKKIGQAKKSFHADFSIDYATDKSYFELDSYNWHNPNKVNIDQKIKVIEQKHKEIKEALIFKGKPEILKAIKALENM